MILVGTCGFKFSDWVGPVYPEDLRETEYLSYYSRALNLETVEIDVSYYTLLSPKAVESWVRKTADSFTFAVKCHKGMTLNEVSPRTIRSQEFSSLPDRDLFRKFIFSFSPLVQTGRLNAFLAQFGPTFFKSSQSMSYLLAFREMMGDHPLVVEFRHKSWVAPGEEEETFAFLEENRMGFAVVDEPGVRQLMPFVPRATLPDLVYVRLHGRNRAWFGADRARRYDYLYSDEELHELADRIVPMEKGERKVLVYFNNCHAGAAMRNAQTFKELLAGQRAV